MSFNESEPRDEHGRWTAGDAVPMNVQNMVNRINMQAAHREVKPSRVHADRVKLAIKTRQHLQNKLYGHGSEHLSHEERMDGERRLRAVNYHLATLAQAERYITKNDVSDEPRDDNGRWTAAGLNVPDVAGEHVPPQFKTFWNHLPEQHRRDITALGLKVQDDPGLTEKQGLLGEFRPSDKAIAVDSSTSHPERHVSSTFFHEVGHAVDYRMGGGQGYWSNSDEFGKAVSRDMTGKTFPVPHYNQLSMSYSSVPSIHREIFADVYAAMHGQSVRGIYKPEYIMKGYPRVTKLMRDNAFWDFDSGKPIRPKKAPVVKSYTGITTSLAVHEGSRVLVMTGEHANGTLSDGSRDVDDDELVGGRKASEYPEGVHLIMRKDAPAPASGPTPSDVHTPNSDWKVPAGKKKKRKTAISVANIQKDMPRYVARTVANGDELTEWCHKNGLHQPHGEFHVTVAYSRRPFPWTPVHKRLTMKPNPSWSVERLGGHVVLRVNHEVLNKRWQSLRKQGASWDYDSYKAHITLASYDKDVDLNKIAPPDFPIILGPEYSMVLKQYLPRSEREEMSKAILFNDLLKKAPPKGTSKDDINDTIGFDAEDDYTGDEHDDEDQDEQNPNDPLKKRYAYTPKDGEPKLDISDKEHVAMAAAALSSGGFRGNRVQLPEGEVAGVKAKVRAAWKHFNPDKDESEMPESLKKNDDVGFRFSIMKIDEEQQVVYGFASVASYGGYEVTDLQDDVVDMGEVTKAAHDFMTNSRMGGDMHERFGTGTIVESMVLDSVLKEALGITRPEEGWLIGYKVTDGDVWSRVKSGELQGFSIGGTGVRTPID